MNGHKWVKFSGVQSIMPEMIHVGRDLDGMALVVGRAYHNGDMLPAKVKPEHGIAYISYNCIEHIKRDFEILLPAEFRWVHAGHGQVPPYAVEGGRTAQGEQLYIGRVFEKGVPCIGKVHKSHGCLYAPFGGKELAFKSYEVLVQN